MPNPGWLQVGLWLRGKSDPEGWFRVNKVFPYFVELNGPHPCTEPLLAKVEFIHSYYLSPRYFECDDCRRKPGIPTLCYDCLQRRQEFYASGEHHCELPRFCSTPFLEYNECWLPMDGPKYIPLVRVPRYKRPWVV